ncbi:amidohydrolase [Rhizobium sp. PDO1-076]|uniref:amidohydrolase n=1 Tax=Rhizobium sp. PDO1-076 TaxID=1125979 RepID=UPI00024E27FE|nr:amidohydrolase [Rhizobium sp. PDO1-076]EHS49314.1 amidohydrolase [Rhizobium sp. PDO1-076]
MAESTSFADMARRDFLKTSFAVSGGAAIATGLMAAVDAKAAVAATSQADLPPPSSVEPAARAVDAVRDAILRISREVWENAELSLEEDISSKIHLRELEAAGFTIVSRGTSNIPTAFIAEWSQGSGGPKIGFLPEYDALPGLGNAAEPRQTPGPAGVDVGHGCGHNMLGAGCTGAAFALKKMMQENGTAGTLRVYGCAAEETQGAKVFMVRDGYFNDLDAALAWHPAPITATGLLRTAAVNMARVRFTGRTAHAGVAPWEGRSGLKGAEMFAVGVQFMREHIEPTSRVHYIYTQGGIAANVVPEVGEILIMIRDSDRERVTAITSWLREIADGAALATQTKAEFDLFFGMHDLIPNETLAGQVLRHMNAIGVDWTEDEQAFARGCQKEMGHAELGLSPAIAPMIPETTTGGATDVGDVSFVTPTALFAWACMPLGVGLHMWPLTACGGMSIGDKAALASARVMAGVGYDLLVDPELRAGARADFDRRLKGRTYVSPLPPERKRPDGIPAHLLLRDGTGELVDGAYLQPYSYE